MPNFNQQIIDEFRANAGEVGGPFEGGRLLLLTTTGARTGAKHTTPLAYLPDSAERVLVIGSAAGSDKHPDWYHNLLADPRAVIETGLFTYDAKATVLTGAERDQAFARAAEANPGWAAYQAKTSRVIPVVALAQAGGGGPRGGSFGELLVRIHTAFRRELALIRRELAESGSSGPGLGAQLRINCLTFCQGLHHHHLGEDTGIFPMLAERFPELDPPLRKLRVEHERIAALVDELQHVIADGDGDLLAEVDRLIETLEAHLTYEENQLIPFLDR
ncbi:nitroreductase/quinone reductase family protein [Flindersiella endophytica]